MPTQDYSEFLLARVADAGQRASLATDPLVKAAWLRIEAIYRQSADPMGPNAGAPDEHAPTLAQAERREPRPPAY